MIPASNDESLIRTGLLPGSASVNERVNQALA